jgi:AsmA protein
MKLLKIVGVTFGVIVTLVVIAAIALWLTFDPNDYKGYIADWVTERTGREFVIEDDLELTFFPWLGVTTGNIRLGNASGFGDDPFASIDGATVSVRLLPLLKRQVEIGTVRLDGLELNLAVDAQGTTNWSDLIGGEDSAETAATVTEERAPLLQSLNIAGVDINDSLIFWRTNTTEVRYVISEVNAESGAISPGQPIEGEISFRIVGVEPQLSADVTASGTMALDTEASNLEARNLRVAFNLADGRGTERAAGSLQIGNVRVALASDDIEITRGNLTAMVVAPPVGPDRAEIQIDFSSALLARDAGTFSVQDLATNIAGIVARWELSGSELFAEPEFRGSVRVVDQPLTAFIDALAIELDTDARQNLGSLSLESAFTARPLTHEVTLPNLAARALGVGLTGELTANADGSISGRFATDTFDPARPLGLLPRESLERIDVAALGMMSTSGQLSYSPATQQISIRDLDVAALDTHITGLINRRTEQGYDGQVTIAALDAVKLAAVIGDLFPAELPPAALGTLALSTGFDYSASAGTLALTDLAARAAGVDVQGALRVASLAESPTWNGRFELMPFDLEALLTRLDRPLPERTDPATLKRARATAEIEGNSSRAVARNLRVVLDDSTITGELTVGFSEPAEYGFKLAIDRLDADRYMPPAAEPPPEGAAPVAADIALPTEPLHNLRLDGEVSVGDLHIAGLSLQAVAAGLKVGDGLGVIDSARAALYGGNFEGRVELDARGEQPRLALDGTATTIQIEPLLTDLRGEANMTGSGSFDLKLAGTGAQLSTVLDGSAGQVSFSLRDGMLRGFDLGRTLCSAYNATQKLPRPAAAAVPITRYQLLRGSADVNEGIASTQDLEATTAFMTVSGRGQSDLVSREINYDLIATLTGSVAIDSCNSMDPLIGDSIPVRVTGTILAPEIQPDYGQIVRGRIRDELQDRLRERLQQRAQ